MVQLQRVGAGSFSGGTDPSVADEWREQMDDLFQSLRCPDQFRVDLAVHNLSGDALQELDAEFSRLVVYAVRALVPESAQVRRFLLALRDDLRTRCRVRTYATRAELVEVAAGIEDDLRSQVVVVNPSVQPKHSQPHSVPSKGGKPASGQKRKYDAMQRSGSDGAGCFDCPQRGEQRLVTEQQAVIEQRAVTEKRADTRVCYHCRETGHIKPRCPKLQQMAVAAVNAGGQLGVQLGMSVGWFMSHVLFDSGATHCFITPECAESANIRGDPDERTGVVKVAGGKFLRVFGRVSDMDIQIAGESRPTDLIISLVELYDVILEMDWLHHHRVHLDCYIGRVVFERPEGKLAGKMIEKGCKAYLVTISMLESVGQSSVGAIRVVKEFEDVFQSLQGLPPSRSDPFTIELEPWTTPLSKAPYRMAPAEMAVLKKQLDDLLSKGKV
ncbi:PREDICTED: uncharacterized protein LOC104715263 [Camelina sativa]|uniref:Uncharacterized protein LOC104715263 n=1 Tax=Camelina sativa TaxID=90675 RepID=A0ABM0TT77_CAMSA|nr:PREDICTED: uncharacterized protein LOC104715263 [Camelina sativa]